MSLSKEAINHIQETAIRPRERLIDFHNSQYTVAHCCGVRADHKKL